MRSERVSFLPVAGRCVARVADVRVGARRRAARLDVDASPSCSTRDELIARVAARSTRIQFVNDAAGVPALTARIEVGARGVVIADLTVVEPDGRKFARRLEAPSCAAATDALALVVAITLDPSAAAAEASGGGRRGQIARHDGGRRRAARAAARWDRHRNHPIAPDAASPASRHAPRRLVRGDRSHGRSWGPRRR